MEAILKLRLQNTIKQKKNIRIYEVRNSIDATTKFKTNL